MKKILGFLLIGLFCASCSPGTTIIDYQIVQTSKEVPSDIRYEISLMSPSGRCYGAGRNYCNEYEIMSEGESSFDFSNGAGCSKIEMKDVWWGAGALYDWRHNETKIVDKVYAIYDKVKKEYVMRKYPR